MSNAMDLDWSDLEDGSFGANNRTAAERAEATNRAMLRAGLEASNEEYRETCTACRGTGKFVSWGGRTVGQCFKCRGKGSKTFKTAPAARAASREYAANRRNAVATEAAKEFAAWSETPEAELVRWGVAKGMDFYVSVLAYAQKHGQPSDGQTASLRRTVAKNAERLAAKVEAKEEAKEEEVFEPKGKSAFLNQENYQEDLRQ